MLSMLSETPCIHESVSHPGIAHGLRTLEFRPAMAVDGQHARMVGSPQARLFGAEGNATPAGEHENEQLFGILDWSSSLWPGHERAAGPWLGGQADGRAGRGTPTERYGSVIRPSPSFLPLSEGF